ncbi:hypothetical protein [Candidatus Hecatella orcuttiae]|jgi:uncharacterized membrane protein YozB (DUF420 family)|uniref:hypothetical protein n=1 Tax=Candidatus Hecatella orcuttiae TaxID=1935119 RepID=UPI0028683122|nr:hypothetical protein [Candidatus Hecatella orcuttiae]
MVGLFGTKAALIYDVNLLLQFVILIILLAGVFAVKKGHFKGHGYLMTFAVALNGALIFAVMGVSLITNFGALMVGPVVGRIITIIHAVIGGFAWILGLILVFKKFGNVRLWMRIVFTTWILALLLGIGFYLFYYI